MQDLTFATATELAAAIRDHMGADDLHPGATYLAFAAASGRPTRKSIKWAQKKISDAAAQDTRFTGFMSATNGWKLLSTAWRIRLAWGVPVVSGVISFIFNTLVVVQTAKNVPNANAADVSSTR